MLKFLMDRLCLQEIKFIELLPVILLAVLRLVFYYIPCLDYFSLPWVMTIVFSVEDTIKWGVLETFLTVVLTLLSLLGKLFVFLGVAVLIWGRKLGRVNIIYGLSPFEVLYEGCKISCFWIKTLWYHHCLVAYRRFFCERIHEFGFIQLLIVVKQGCNMCHPWIKIANQSQILSCSDLSRFFHFVMDVALLLGEALFWAKIGHNMVHDQY